MNGLRPRLAISCSHEIASLAIENNSCVYTLNLIEKNKHSELIHDALAELFNKASCDLKDLSEIYVDSGPGSFTGVRLAANISKTIGMTFNIPIRSSSSLQVMLEELKNLNNIFEAHSVAISKAHSGLFYFLVDGKIEIELLNSEQIHEILNHQNEEFFCVGDSQDIFIENKNLKKSKINNPDAQYLFKMNPQNLKTDSWIDFEPLYIRKSAAEERHGG